MKPPKIFLVIPVFNEERHIGPLVAAAPRPLISEVVVVNDGSTDQTAEEARRYGATVLSHPKRRLLGAAIRTGLGYAREQRVDIVVIMAGNGKDDPQEIPRLVTPILEGRADLVQGSRYLPGGHHAHMPWQRLAATRLYSWMLRHYLRRPITDGTNGFRAFTVTLLQDQRIDLWQPWLDSTALEFYFFIKVCQLGYRAIEVPVSKCYPPRSRWGSSVQYTKVRPMIDWWNIVKPMLYLSLRIKH